MNRRHLGNSDLRLTTIGLGTWAIGGADWAFGWGRQSDEEAIAAVIRAVDLGINWVDTAAVYGNGHSERLVGRALSELPPSEHPIVATKFGRVIQPDGSVKGILRPDSIRAECEASLERLGVEAIDLYQMHWPDPDEAIEEAWTTMVALKEEGKVRHIGVSNCSVEQLQRLEPIHHVTSLQPPYNLIIRGIEEETIGYCGEHGIGIVCYSPMCKGLLTGTFSSERAAALSEADHRSRDPKFSEPQLAVHLKLVDDLRALAQRAGRSTAELAIAWTLRKVEVTSAIVGARRPEQIEATTPASDWHLDSELVTAIDTLLDEHEQAIEQLGGANTGRV